MVGDSCPQTFDINALGNMRLSRVRLIRAGLMLPSGKCRAQSGAVDTASHLSQRIASLVTRSSMAWNRVSQARRCVCVCCGIPEVHIVLCSACVR